MMSEKAVFLDRDNTLIEDPGYINSPSQIKLLPGAVEALAELKKMGYKLVIVTNQSAVARGIVTVEVLDQIHQKLTQLFAQKGVYIDQIYYCPFHPDGVIPEYRKESELRKPNPGMLLIAAEEMKIDLSMSWMIGDSYRDVSAGKAAGCMTIMINSPATKSYKKPQDPVPDEQAVNIKEAVNIIKMYDRNAEKAIAKETTPETHSYRTPEIEKTDQPEPVDPPVKTHTAKAVDRPVKTYTAKTVVVKQEREDKTEAEPGEVHSGKTHRLLEEMLKHLKSQSRTDMFEDFSIMKFFAGAIQIGVPFCLLLSFWYLMDPQRPTEAVHTTIGYAIVLQLMAIAFYIMRDRK
jgi:D-glycero-D-manno-heptose 1,7-bisphosphate phosphatase